MLTLYARAGLQALPVFGGGGDGLPERSPSREGVGADPAAVAAYDRVCGFGLRDTLPSTYLHVLAFPLALALLVDRSFPFSALGLVHVRNRIVQHRPVGLGERVDLVVRAQRLAEHARGRTVDLAGEARIGGELVWEDVSTYLHHEGKPRTGGERRPDTDREDTPELPERARWELPGDLGRRYAAVSGDRNPIHLHPLSAKAFGLRSPIAHGMWVKARCLAALADALPPAYAVDVRFRAPLFLPARVAFASSPEGGFAVRSACDGKPHLEGEVEALG
ncbi:MAG: MaoC domain protein dehydratase [Solirubrobacterales bacterium]|jgi:acyl dehydratase|nr:MaoC domain protein dehydratase [Solirubrobacterales bacterium]